MAAGIVDLHRASRPRRRDRVHLPRRVRLQRQHPPRPRPCASGSTPSTYTRLSAGPSLPSLFFVQWEAQQFTGCSLGRRGKVPPDRTTGWLPMDIRWPMDSTQPLLSAPGRCQEKAALLTLAVPRCPPVRWLAAGSGNNPVGQRGFRFRQRPAHRSSSRTGKRPLMILPVPARRAESHGPRNASRTLRGQRRPDECADAASDARRAAPPTGGSAEFICR